MGGGVTNLARNSIQRPEVRKRIRREEEREELKGFSRLDDGLDFEASHGALLDHLRLFRGGNLVADQFGILFDRVAGDDKDLRE
jgi:hypothetical protein